MENINIFWIVCDLVNLAVISRYLYREYKSFKAWRIDPMHRFNIPGIVALYTFCILLGPVFTLIILLDAYVKYKLEEDHYG